MRWRRSAPKQGELEGAERARDVALQIGRTFSRAFLTYTEIAPDGRSLTSEDAAAARQQLLAITLCLCEIRTDQDLIDWLAGYSLRARKDKDVRSTIAVMRMMQRSYGLALSNDADRRKSAISSKELGQFVIPRRLGKRARPRRAAGVCERLEG
jgi:hypothetical protein